MGSSMLSKLCADKPALDTHCNIACCASTIFQNGRDTPECGNSPSVRKRSSSFFKCCPCISGGKTDGPEIDAAASV